jgi:uncharacterized protein (DUF2235 family)
MPKVIVFCADGTWNGPAQPDQDNGTARPTNVFKMFLSLDGHDTLDTVQLAKEQERTLHGTDGALVQIAKYIHGVGDSDNFLVKAIGGAGGVGLITRVVRGYTFISRNYLDGDHIFLIGFSRGAYTARALAGLIAAEGLLDATRIDLTDRDNAYRLGSAVWYHRLRSVRQSNSNLLGRLQDLALDLPGFLSRPPPPDRLIRAPIQAVGVWETVGALGIPAFALNGTRIDTLQFADTALSPVVRHAFHAVAVDERRADYAPTLWDPDARITQVLFPGAHADVGGGYPTTNGESGLSDCAFLWMKQQLEPLGVRFAAAPVYAPRPDPLGTAHQPWRHPPWVVLQQASRAFPAGLSHSQCLDDRLAGGPVVAEPGEPRLPYGPANV